MRLIDADALLEDAGVFETIACARGCGKSTLAFAKGWLQGSVCASPTIDAVPVVRCKDCKHITPVEGGLPLCTLHNIACAYDGFCSEGERKDGVT